MPAVRCAKFVHFEEKPELKDLNRAHLKKFFHTKFNLAKELHLCDIWCYAGQNKLLNRIKGLKIIWLTGILPIRLSLSTHPRSEPLMQKPYHHITI